MRFVVLVATFVVVAWGHSQLMRTAVYHPSRQTRLSPELAMGQRRGPIASVEKMAL